MDPEPIQHNSLDRLQINHITVYVGSYTETDKTGVLTPNNKADCLAPTEWVCFEPSLIRFLLQCA